MRKALSLTVLCIVLAAGFALAGCASIDDVKALQGRVGAVEQVVQAKADKSEVKEVGTRVGSLEKVTGAALNSVVDQLAKLNAVTGQHGVRLAALDAAKTEQEKKLAAVAVEAAAQKATIVKIEDRVAKQAAQNGKLVAALRAHRRGDKLELVKHRVALGDKAPDGAVQCWGFTSGKADLDELLKRSPDCKKQLDEAKEQIAANKAEVLGIVGFEDRVKCKEPVTDECRDVAKLRAEAVVQYMGLTGGGLVSTEAPTDDIGASHRENRGVVVFVKKK
ncbi:MAG: hypothetical protein HYT39_02155 [Candidatus Sungbacteria bacterium]|nr:hypothetical protein [Candidatus Sungbacteria bacterium]